MTLKYQKLMITYRKLGFPFIPGYFEVSIRDFPPHLRALRLFSQLLAAQFADLRPTFLFALLMLTVTGPTRD